MSETKCGKKAICRFTWAGRGEESYACEEHAKELAALCNFMGWQQIFIQLPDDTDKTCRSNIEEGESE